MAEQKVVMTIKMNHVQYSRKANRNALRVHLLWYYPNFAYLKKVAREWSTYYRITGPTGTKWCPKAPYNNPGETFFNSNQSTQPCTFMHIHSRAEPFHTENV